MILPFTYLQASLIASNAVNTLTKIVLTNDDGWAVAQIRAQNDALKAAGYDVRTGFVTRFYDAKKLISCSSIHMHRLTFLLQLRINPEKGPVPLLPSQSPNRANSIRVLLDHRRKDSIAVMVSLYSTN